jgi:CMP-2-keto-3-deoxyoctulosonic acid synthetase
MPSGIGSSRSEAAVAHLVIHIEFLILVNKEDANQIKVVSDQPRGIVFTRTDSPWTSDWG